MKTRINLFVVAVALVSLCSCLEVAPPLGSTLDASRPSDGGAADGGTATDASVEPDAGTTFDAGGPVDAGARPDAGTVLDAGSPFDGGSPFDAGTPPDGGTKVDAGGVTDAGRVDGGVTRPDAGMGSADSGANPTLATLGDNTALDLGLFTCTDPDTGTACRQVTDYSGFVYDSKNHQMLMFGGGHATTMTDVLFAFDLDSTLSWKELYAPTPCNMMTASNLEPTLGAWKAGASGPYPRPLSVHSYDLTVFAPGQNEFVLISRLFTGGYCNQTGNDVGGPVAHYNLGAKSWLFSNVNNATSGATIDAAEFDPVSGKIVIYGGLGLGLYDPESLSYTNVSSGLSDSQGNDPNVPAPGYANHLTYFPPNDTFYLFVRSSPATTFALKLNRATPKNSTLDRLNTKGPAPMHGEPGYAYDSHNQVLGGAVDANVFYALDPVTGEWTASTIQGGTPGRQAFHALNYDPVNNVFIFVTEARHTWAYRFKN